MPSKEERSRIDAQWQRLQPGWGPKDYEGERTMLYDLLEPGEDIGLLHRCGFEAWDSRHDRGIVVATGEPGNPAEPGPADSEQLPFHLPRRLRKSRSRNPARSGSAGREASLFKVRMASREKSMSWTCNLRPSSSPGL